MVQCVETEESKFLELMRNLFNMYRFKPAFSTSITSALDNGKEASSSPYEMALQFPAPGVGFFCSSQNAQDLSAEKVQ